jgi:Pyruvate/2-oxoacid:ferredoxin oxidoreductase delta subunit
MFKEELEYCDVPNCFRTLFLEKKDFFPIEEIRQFGYSKDSMGFFLKYDKFEELQQLSTFPNFNVSAKIFISPCDLPSGITLEEESLLSVSVFYGSVECFKFLLLNGAEVTSSVCVSAVKGGDLEIIQICELEHVDFSDCLQASVAYLRNDVADWLLQNFNVNSFQYVDCIKCLNFPAFTYLHAKGCEVCHPVGTDFDSLTSHVSS